MLVKERNLRKLLLLVGILMMAVAFAGCQQTPLQVTIPDSALEVALRNALNKPEGPIYKSDLESLTSLDLVEKNISDISALSGLSNLKELYLGKNNISDISALSGLSKLKTLSLWENNISGISALSGLSNLKTLDLDKNNISDISALSGLSKLKTLSLWENNISDISVLSGLSNLKVLYLGENNVSDISALADLSNPSGLYLNGNNITDISALVRNIWVDNGDIVNLADNPLSPQSINVYIPLLKARGARGVIVTYSLAGVRREHWFTD